MDKSDLLAMVRETKGFHFFLGNSAKLGNRVRDICLLLSRDSCTSRPTDILDAVQQDGDGADLAEFVDGSIVELLIAVFLL
jgi:hypothetical protein